MEKITKTIYKKFPPCKLYYDDIEKIFNIFKTTCEDTMIATEEYDKITNLNDLKKIKPKKIKIYTYQNDYKEIDIEEDLISISVYDSLINKGIVTSISEILNKTKKKSNIIYNIINSYITMTIIISSSVIYAYFYHPTAIIYWTPISLFILISYIANFIIKNKNIFILDKTRDNHNYYQENKEWIIPLGTTIIGLIIGKYI